MNRLILFAHFDPANRIAPHVLHHLQALRALGGRLHFLSNSPLPESEQDKLEGLADQILLRENTGLDFGMWQAALGQVELAPFDELLLTNSSLVGPFVPLAPLFGRMEAVACDFWGMTESWEGGRHLQSYFLVFRKAALESPAFGRFWAGVLPFRSKQNIIYSCEMGLSVWLQEQGLVACAAFPLDPAFNTWRWNLAFRGRLTFRLRRSKNPTLYYPDLLVKAGMPYLKVSLLQPPATGFLPRLRQRWVRGLSTGR